MAYQTNAQNSSTKNINSDKMKRLNKNETGRDTTNYK